MLLSEFQRYGRNKSTVINKSYIESGEYRRKFDVITDDANLARLLYTKAKEMLYHRSGTEYEDMYWIDIDSHCVIASALNESEKERVIYTPNILKAVNSYENVIAMHNHPHSMPPSLDDLNSSYFHGYLYGMVICHDGSIYKYTSKAEIRGRLYDVYYMKYSNKGYDELNAQLFALKELMRNDSIVFEEVISE